jgi:hypothetical protein
MLNIEQTAIALGAGALVGVLASLPSVQGVGAYTPGIAALGIGAVAGLMSKNGGAMTVASYSALGVGSLLLVSAYKASKPATTQTAGAFMPFNPVRGMLPLPTHSEQR